jgi:hypothetical protein
MTNSSSLRQETLKASTANSRIAMTVCVTVMARKIRPAQARMTSSTTKASRNWRRFSISMGEWSQRLRLVSRTICHRFAVFQSCFFIFSPLVKHGTFCTTRQSREVVCAGLPALWVALLGYFVQRCTQLFGCLLRATRPRVRPEPKSGRTSPCAPTQKLGRILHGSPELIRAQSCTCSNQGSTGVSVASRR